MPLIGLGESELERLDMDNGEKPETDSRDEGKHTGRNDLLLSIYKCKLYTSKCK